MKTISMQANEPLISVTVVSYNSASDIARCLHSLAHQDWPNFEVVVVDNASADGSVEILMEFGEAIHLVCNSFNVGFSAAQNQAIHESSGEYVVSLNLDTRAEPSFLRMMWLGMQADEGVGIVCPKILRMELDGQISQPALLDSAGVFATPDMRHHNRGSQAFDTGQFQQPKYVFGYTGAAAMFRRSMLEDLAVNGMILDEDFFAYREDSDLSWRAQLAGWRCLYTPYAVVYHQRHVFEDHRDRVSGLINMHSVKNRFLLRINNLTAGVFWRTCFAATLRDLGVLTYVLLKERTSIPGLRFIIRDRKRLWEKRARIQEKKKVSERYMKQWFRREAVCIELSASTADVLRKRSTRTND